MSGQKGKVHLGPNVSSSAHYCGCVVNGSSAMAAILILVVYIFILVTCNKNSCVKTSLIVLESTKYDTHGD